MFVDTPVSLDTSDNFLFICVYILFTHNYYNIYMTTILTQGASLCGYTQNNEEKVIIADPAKGIIKMTPEVFFKMWIGVLTFVIHT